MADDDFPEDENEDFEDEDEGEPEPEEEPRRAKKKAARKPRPRIRKAPRVAEQPAPPDDGLTEEERWHAHRLRVGYSEPLPPGMGMAQGVEGWDMEWEIASAWGQQDVARLILKRMKPPGPDMKPLDLGSVFPSQVPGGQALFDYLCENYSLPQQEVVIQWKLFNGHPLRLGEMRLPVKTARAPAPANGAFGAAPQERAGAGPHNAGSPGSPPPWGPAPAGYGGYPSPPGYYPPPQYPPPAPPRAEPPAPPPPAPVPAGTSPESVAYIRAIEAQLAQANARLWERVQSHPEDAETQQLRDRLRRMEEQLAQATAPQQPAPQPAPAAPPPKPKTLEEEIEDAEKKVATFRRLAQAWAPPAPAPAPEAPAAETSEPDDPVQVIPGGGTGPDIVIDRESGDVRWGVTAAKNAQLGFGMLKEFVDYMKKAAIEVKQTPSGGSQGRGNQGGGSSPPPVSGGSGAGKAFGS